MGTDKLKQYKTMYLKENSEGGTEAQEREETCKKHRAI